MDGLRVPEIISIPKLTCFFFFLQKHAVFWPCFGGHPCVFFLCLLCPNLVFQSLPARLCFCKKESAGEQNAYWWTWLQKQHRFIALRLPKLPYAHADAPTDRRARTATVLLGTPQPPSWATRWPPSPPRWRSPTPSPPAWAAGCRPSPASTCPGPTSPAATCGCTG